MRLVRQEDEDRRTRQEGANLGRIIENESVEEEDTEDDEGDGDEREIWSVTHVTEEDFETTEGETEDVYDKLKETTIEKRTYKVVHYWKHCDISKVSQTLTSTIQSSNNSDCADKL